MPKYTPIDLALNAQLTMDGEIIAELWSGDLRDDRGTVYRDGAHQVKITAKGRAAGVPAKTKTFKGETAWMDAERVWRDIQMWLRYAA